MSSSISTDTRLNVQYGCGLSSPEGWENFDTSPTLRLQRLPLVGKMLLRKRADFPDTVRIGDVTKKLPIGDSSCEAVYCSHTLEHLSLADFRKALLESKRILKSGATFRGVLPDLAAYVAAYSESNDPEASSVFMRETYLGKAARPRGIKGAITTIFANNAHLWMWDYKNLALELEQAGFADIRRAEFGDSPNADFAAVEDRDRWVGHLGFDCKKP